MQLAFLCVERRVVVDGVEIVIPPMKVSQRLKLSVLCGERGRADAVKDGRAVGLEGDDLARYVALNRAVAEQTVGLARWAATTDGALCILAELVGMENAERIVSATEPAALYDLALNCLGFDYRGERKRPMEDAAGDAGN